MFLRFKLAAIYSPCSIRYAITEEWKNEAEELNSLITNQCGPNA